MIYTADFETTTQTPAVVWCWGLSQIDNPDFFEYGETIEEFLLYFKSLKSDVNCVYFHNLKFDGGFIIDWLLKNGYVWKDERKYCEGGDFTTIITGDSKFYVIDIYFGKHGKTKKHVKIYDSAKLLSLSVKSIAESFELDIKKGKIDYDRHNKECEITKEEIEYLRNDVQIMAKALNKMFELLPEKITVGSCALADYIEFIGGKKRFEQSMFPVLPNEIDVQIRRAYKGGFTAINRDHAGKIIDGGIVLDVNSLYPHVMHDCVLPYGEPVYFEGEYNKKCKAKYPLYIQNIDCVFKIKENKIPIIQLHHSSYYLTNDYLTQSVDKYGEPCTINMTVTNIDLEMIKNHYDIEILSYNGGYMFRGSDRLFCDWVDKWMKLKIEADRTGNKGRRKIAKLIQNSLYGKFGLNPIIKSKKPVLNEEKNKIEYENIKYIVTDENGDIMCDINGEVMETDKKVRDGIYIPIAVFVTAYARKKTIETAQKIHEESILKYGESRWLYSDTDSLHLKGFDIPAWLDVDQYNLGAWKIESVFERGKFLQAKRYIEDNYIMLDDEIKTDINGNPINVLKNGYGEPITQIKVTCAGLQAKFHNEVTFENFNYGAKFRRLVPETVEGGVILKEIEFTLQMKDGLTNNSEYDII